MYIPFATKRIYFKLWPSIGSVLEADFVLPKNGFLSCHSFNVVYVYLHIDVYIFSFVSYISLISLPMLMDFVMLLSPSKLAPSILKRLHPKWDISDCLVKYEIIDPDFSIATSLIHGWCHFEIDHGFYMSILGISFLHSILRIWVYRWFNIFDVSKNCWVRHEPYLRPHEPRHLAFSTGKNDLLMRKRKALNLSSHIKNWLLKNNLLSRGWSSKSWQVGFWEQNGASLFCLKTNCFTFAWRRIWWGNHSLWGNLHVETAIWTRMSMKINKKVPQKHETSWCYHSIKLFKPLRTKEAYNRCSHDTFW